MKTYSEVSTLTVRERIQRSYSSKIRKHNPYVTIHNNADGDGYLFGFYLDDWESPFDDFQSFKELDFRLDTESKSQERLTLGINYSRSKPAEPKRNWL